MDAAAVKAIVTALEQIAEIQKAMASTLKGILAHLERSSSPFTPGGPR